MSYQRTKNYDGSNSDIIKRVNDSGSISFIPNDPLNLEYQAFQAWVDAGNTPQPAV